MGERRYVVYRCLYGEDFVKESIRSIAPFVDKIFVFWTDQVWGGAIHCTYKGQRIDFPPNGRFDNILDRLNEVAMEFPQMVYIQRDHVANNRSQFTHLVNDRILPHYDKPDMIIMMEVDYVWRQDQLRKAFEEFNQLPVRHATTDQVELWKTFEWRAMRNDPNRKAVMFWDMNHYDKMPPTNRHADAAGMGKLSAYVHNLGFCASVQGIYWKHLTAIGYAQKIGDSPPSESWYDDVWMAWTLENRVHNLEMSAGYEHLIPEAVPYTDALPEVLG